jgi:hypothetical protein
MANELTHVSITTGHSRSSARGEAHNDIMEILKPIIVAGQGNIGGLHINIESGKSFTLAWEPGIPAVRCWFARESDPATWEAAGGQGPEPPAPWVAVELLTGALRCTPEGMFMLGDAERCIAWALLEGHMPHMPQ